MGFSDRIKKGLIGAALRYGVAEGTAQAIQPRRRDGPTADTNYGASQDVREALDVGLPSGEASLEELAEERDMQKVFGVSMEELRLLSGIKDPFGECKFDPSTLPDFGGLEEFHAARKNGIARGEARTLVERIATEKVSPPAHLPRIYGRNHDEALDATPPRRR